MKHISKTAISIDSLISQAHHPEAGALVIFSGEARNHHQGKSVDYLEYEAQEQMAESSIAGILSDARQKWPLQVAIAVHRIGKVEISQPAVVVITASAHRNQAYEANRYIIDRIKSESPIWKNEFFSNGQSAWSEPG